MIDKLENTVIKIEPKLGSKSIITNGTYKACNEELEGYSEVDVNIQPKLLKKDITENGTYKAIDEGIDGYSEVTVATSGGTSNYKIEKQVYTPVEDETEHTFTHNLGVVPDLIAIYIKGLPTLYSATYGSLSYCIGLKDGIFNLTNETRYTKSCYAYKNASGGVYCASETNLDSSITKTSGQIRNATNNSFDFNKGTNGDLHLAAGLTYYIVIMAGVDE